jgi:hypothetical protein
MIRVLILLSLTIFVPEYSTCFAQVKQTHRFEIEQKGSDENFTIIPLKNGDLVLLRERNKYNGNKRLWEATILDTTLQKRNQIEFHIEERYPMIGYEIDNDKLYLLFRMGDTNKNNLLLVEVHSSDSAFFERNEIKPEVDLKITHFSKAGGSLVLAGYVNNEPAILLYELSTRSMKVVPGFFQKDTELVDLQVNQNQTFNTILIDRSVKSEKKFVLKTFDQNGKVLLEDIIPLDEQRYLQGCLSSTLLREDMLVLGTWGDRTNKQSSGFFSIRVDPFNEQKIKYYHFGELEHFLDYLNPKRAERIKSNTKKDIAAGNTPSFTTFVVPYKLVENAKGFYLLAEVYNNNVSSPNGPYYGSPYSNPYYANPYAMYNPFWYGYYPGLRYRSSTSLYGNPQPNPKSTDQVKTYATILAHFDGNGNLQWDQSVKLDDIEKPELEQVADFLHTQDELYFIYKKKSDLKIKTILFDKDSTAEISQKIKLNDPGDEIRQENEHQGGLKHWIDKSFYVWGYETIRNMGLKEDRTRDVFYINKIVIP